MSESLADALRAESEKLAQYRVDGFETIPLATVLKSLQRVAVAAQPFTDFLSEAEAKLRSNKSANWLRTQFPAWESRGLARWNPSKPKARQYLRAAVPQRANVEAARADGLRVELGA